MVDQGLVGLRAHVVDVGLDLAVHRAGHRLRLALADHGPQHIGDVEVAHAHAIANHRRRKALRRREGIDRHLQYGRAGGRGCLALNPAVGTGHAGQDFLGRRRGHWQAAMGAIDEAAAHFDSVAKHPLHPKGVEADRRADHINNGVHCAHLVEVDPIHGYVVNLGLRHGDAFKDGQRLGLDARRQPSVLDQSNDVAVAPVRAVATTWVAKVLNARPSADNALLAGPLKLNAELRRAGQPRQALAQRRLRDTQVHHRAKVHIAADAGAALVVKRAQASGGAGEVLARSGGRGEVLL